MELGTESATALLERSAVELHTDAELPGWSLRQGCSCGQNFPSTADRWRHQAEGRLASLKGLLGISDPVRVDLTKVWSETDGVWSLSYYNGDKLVMQSGLFVESVVRYTEAGVSGWRLTDESLSGEGFFGPLLKSLSWAKVLVEAFEDTLDRKRNPIDGEPAIVSHIRSYVSRPQSARILREMVEVMSGDEKLARQYNGDTRNCPACDAELTYHTCQNLCCPLGIAHVATTYPDDLDEDLLPF